MMQPTATAAPRGGVPKRVKSGSVDLDRLVDGVVTFGGQSLAHVSLRLLGVLGVKAC